MIYNVKGDLLKSKALVRCHQVNCLGIMGAGIAKQIRNYYPYVFDQYKPLCDVFGKDLLGEVQFVACHDKTVIANCFGQIGVGTHKQQTDVVAVEEYMTRVRRFCAGTGASCGFPKYIGAGLGGGSWDEIYAIIKDLFEGSPVECYIVELPKGGNHRGRR